MPCVLEEAFWLPPLRILKLFLIIYVMTKENQGKKGFMDSRTWSEFQRAKREIQVEALLVR
jgi:hypothetical protein